MTDPGSGALTDPGAAGPRLPTGSVAGRAILVTGAARGIGAELARRLAARGARLALVGLEPERLADLAGELGPPSCHVAADVTDRIALTAAIDSAAARLGGLDVVVANAGIQAFGSVELLAPDVFERVLAVNLLGAYHTLRAGIPHVRRRRGYLLAVSSMAMAVHSPLQGHYNASKAGLAALADSLRLELAPAGVAVGVAHPTFVATDMMRDTHVDPLGSRLWGGNRRLGLWGMISVGRAADGLVRAIERRSRRAVIPRALTPVVLAPGLFAPLVERAFPAARVAELLDLEVQPGTRRP